MSTDSATTSPGLGAEYAETASAAYRAAGPQAVQGFRQVLEAMMDPEMRRHFEGGNKAGGR